MIRSGSRSPAGSARSGGRRSRLLPASAAALAVVGGVTLHAGLRSSGGPPQPPAASAAVAAPPGPSAAASPPQSPDAGRAEAAGERFGPSLPRSRPVRLDVPAIGVHSKRIVDLQREPDGQLQVPTNFGTPGWYVPGSAPGQIGPAVLAGHVDSVRGAAVFFRLGALDPGDQVRITRADGRTVVFRVDRVASYPKNRFPTTAVYGDTTHRAELRLITCGGRFDPATRHYVDNVVVFAHLV